MGNMDNFGGFRDDFFGDFDKDPFEDPFFKTHLGINMDNHYRNDNFRDRNDNFFCKRNDNFFK